MTYQPHRRENVTTRPVALATNEADRREAASGYTYRNGVKAYCCYGMYCDVGHSTDCKHARPLTARLP